MINLEFLAMKKSLPSRHDETVHRGGGDFQTFPFQVSKGSINQAEDGKL